MQELIVIILLGVVVLAAAVTYVVAGRKKSGMTRKQEVMLLRIMISAAILLGLQLIPAEAFVTIDGYLFSVFGTSAALRPVSCRLFYNRI